MHCHQEEDRKSEAFDQKPITKLANWLATSKLSLSCDMNNCKLDDGVKSAVFRP